MTTRLVVFVDPREGDWFGWTEGGTVIPLGTQQGILNAFSSASVIVWPHGLFIAGEGRRAEEVWRLLAEFVPDLQIRSSLPANVCFVGFSFKLVKTEHTVRFTFPDERTAWFCSMLLSLQKWCPIHTDGTTWVDVPYIPSESVYWKLVQTVVAWQSDRLRITEDARPVVLRWTQ